MSFLHGPIYLLRGMRLIRQPGLRRFVIIPLLINIVLFGSAIWLAAAYFDLLLEQVLTEGLDWLRWLLWPLFVATVSLVTFYSFTLIANLAGAPFNGLLAEAVTRSLQSEPATSSSLWQSIKQAPQDVANEFFKLGYFLSRSLPLLLLFLIPGVNLLAPILWFGFGAWMLALEYLDYPMANDGLKFKDERQLARQRPALVFGFGASVLLMTMIPILNFIAMPAAVAGATILYHEHIRPNSRTPAIS